jgi:hypothetical protein
LDTEDVLPATETSCNAEDMVDQTKMTEALKLMSNAQVDHGSHITSKQEVNSESPEKDGLKEEVQVTYGDQSLPTTSGITTTVLKLSVEILAMLLVLEPEPETITTENLSTLKLDTEDAQLEAKTS